MAALRARAEIRRESDDQFTVAILARREDEKYELMVGTPTSNLTMLGAFNAARDGLAALLNGQTLISGQIQVVIDDDPTP